MVTFVERRQPPPLEPPPHKHGQAALIETVLEIVDSALEDLEAPGDDAQERKPRTDRS